VWELPRLRVGVRSRAESCCPRLSGGPSWPASRRSLQKSRSVDGRPAGLAARRRLSDLPSVGRVSRRASNSAVLLLDGEMWGC
jgi:hypothetical protein